MNCYLDTSVAVALLSAEGRADAVRRWLSGHRNGFGVVSWWVDAEVSSALAKRRRVGELTSEREDVARAFWRTAQATALRVVPVERPDYLVAADFCARRGVTFRSGDALHLAVANRLNLAVATFDKGMMEAARQLGMPVATVP